MPIYLSMHNLYPLIIFVLSSPFHSQPMNIIYLKFSSCDKKLDFPDDTYHQLMCISQSENREETKHHHSTHFIAHAGMSWIRWAGLDRIVWVGLDRTGSDRIGSDRIGFNWMHCITLDWLGLQWI